MELGQAQQEYDHLRVRHNFGVRACPEKSPWDHISRDDREKLNTPLNPKMNIARETVTKYADQAHTLLAGQTETGAQSYRPLHCVHDKTW